MKHLIFVIFINVFKICLSQQNYSIENHEIYSKYNFIDYSKNYFYNVTNRNFNNFFGKIDTLILFGNKKIKILHIGDSHVQADIFTTKIREYFKDFFLSKISPPSILFPYRPLLNTNEPISYKTYVSKSVNAFTIVKNDSICSPTGLIFEILPSDSITIAFKINTKIYNEFNIVKLLVSSYVDVQLRFPYDELQVLEVCTQDLLKEYILKIGDYTDTCSIRLVNNTSSKIFCYGIMLDDDNYGLSYITLGINGLKAKSLNKIEFENLFLCEDFDLFILSIGTNDCFNNFFDSTEVFNFYNNFFTRLRRIKPNMPILVIIPMSFYNNKNNEPEKNILIVRNVLVYLSKRWNYAYWDLFSVAGGLNAINYWFQNNLTVSDKVHLNKNGYYLLANLFFEAFFKTYLLK
ncbi:MAG: GDSL-type esterase/lipase family protein [Bacteroidales bacterium]|nr:GDSL-type esterase/lipase family protein [Bacteroidales bacterium]